MNMNVRVSAVGDIMLGDFPLTMGFGVRSVTTTRMPYDLFHNVKHLLSDSDICFGNLESVLSDQGKLVEDLKTCQMRGDPRFVKALKAAGFNVMSIANNHSMQHGGEAFKETCGLLTEEGINAVGVAGDDGRVVPVHMDIKGFRVSVLGYSLRPEKYSSYTLYAQPSVDNILDDIKCCKFDNDIIILSLHWGDEFVRVPSPEQIKAAHAFVDAGASLVIGHHPHILQGIEFYKNAVIAYSMGNFIFDFWQKKFRETAILQCELSANGVESCQLMPAYIGKDYCVSEVFGAKKQSAILMLDKLSAKIQEVDVTSEKYYKTYEALVKYSLFLNQIENRVFFLRNMFKYQSWVLKQSLKNFMSSRISRDSR